MKNGNEGRRSSTIPFIRRRIFLRKIRSMTRNNYSAFNNGRIVNAPKEAIITRLLQGMVLRGSFHGVGSTIKRKVLITCGTFNPFICGTIKINNVLRRRMIMNLFRRFNTQCIVILFRRNFRTENGTFFFKSTYGSLKRVRSTTTLFRTRTSRRRRNFT